MTQTIQREKDQRVTSSSSSSSWRSLGWCPLSYPVSKAFFCQNLYPNHIDHDHDNKDQKETVRQSDIAINFFFPLHQDVLLAAARELLILDGAIAASSLQVTPMESNRTTQKRKHDEIDNKKKTEKTEKTKKKKSHCNKGIKALIEYQQKHNPSSWPISAEDLALDTVLQSSWNHVVSLSCTSNEHNHHHQQQQQQQQQQENDTITCSTNPPPLQTIHMVATDSVDRIRKVSDAEEDPMRSSISSTKQLSYNDDKGGKNYINTTNPLDMSWNHPFTNDTILPQGIVLLDNIQSGNIHVDNEKVQHTFQALFLTQTVQTMNQSQLLELKSHLPEFIDLSIMMEEYLRKVSLDMVTCLVKNISDEAVREFLGYKSSMLKKSHVISLMSDVLFDVSHALFAWEQTESELYEHDPSSKKKDVSVTTMDSHICKLLFDARALRKIGGFEPSSLLCHALSIGRLRSKSESWANHRMTNEGKKMFAHHDNRAARVNAGLLRRSKRRKMNHHHHTTTIKSLELSNDGGNAKRLRSCSLASDVMEVNHGIVIPTPLSGVMTITIRRQEGEKWGILLAKEGTICVVMRAPMSNETSSLQVGDLILSASNEHGEKAAIPTNGTVTSSGWFTETTSLFKKSHVMHLEIRSASQKR